MGGMKMLNSIINQVEDNSHILRDINTIINEDPNIAFKIALIDANEKRILNGALQLKQEVERLSADISLCEEGRRGNSNAEFVCPARQRLISILTN